MRVLIVEDEIPARAKLVQMLRSVDADIEIVGEVGSVKESVAWLKANPEPDIAFIDIHLSDDHSFSIFDQVQASFPVVFTTAYDKYLLESFEYNSIDYLLKPVTLEKLQKTLAKVSRLQQHFLQSHLDALRHGEQHLSRRVVARKGTEFLALLPEEIVYFYTDHKIVFLRDVHGRILIIDRTLGELEQQLKGSGFFRINRKYLAHARGIEKFKSESGRILVCLNPAVNEDVYVSKETAPAFRLWIGKK